MQNPKTGAIELSPIIVDQDQLSGDVSEPQPIETGVNGNVISVNDENNFVIVNLGQDTGLQLGDKLNVYRGAEYIAGLEIIQVRKDIAAADIKKQNDSDRSRRQRSVNFQETVFESESQREDVAQLARVSITTVSRHQSCPHRQQKKSGQVERPFRSSNTNPMSARNV